jgi:hypothetical protein
MLSIKNFLTIFPFCPLCHIATKAIPKKKIVGCPCGKFYGTRMMRDNYGIFSMVVEKVIDELQSLRYHYVIHNHQMNILLLKRGFPIEDRFFNTVSNNLAFQLFSQPDKMFDYFKSSTEAVYK